MEAEATVKTKAQPKVETKVQDNDMATGNFPVGRYGGGKGNGEYESKAEGGGKGQSPCDWQSPGGRAG